MRAPGWRGEGQGIRALWWQHAGHGGVELCTLGWHGEGAWHPATHHGAGGRPWWRSGTQVLALPSTKVDAHTTIAGLRVHTLWLVL